MTPRRLPLLSGFFTQHFSCLHSSHLSCSSHFSCFHFLLVKGLQSHEAQPSRLHCSHVSDASTPLTSHTDFPPFSSTDTSGPFGSALAPLYPAASFARRSELTPSHEAELEDVSADVGVEDLDQGDVHVERLQPHPGEGGEQEVVQQHGGGQAQPIGSQAGQPAVQ